MPTALIADDEIALAEFLKTELAELWPELKIVALAYNGVDALRLIDDIAPDIAFLDIRMPGLSGLEVASRLVDADAAPHMVFVTAYDQYAVDAFEREAVDYLLKPPSRERLGKTLDKLKRQLGDERHTGSPMAGPDPELLAKLAALLGQPTPSSPRLEWIRAAHGNETRLIAVDEVVYFEARDKYVSVFTADGESLIRTPLRELLDGLDPARFWQVHRGTIVAVRHIAGTVRDFRGRTLVKLKTRADQLVVSRAYLHLFKQM
ncbi:LytTR family DNA-binding domain-containing protein [Chitinimonas viridis]|uniref:LytTR family DNA-binding domain-containing protein n=1 Tax=Chitinimonas viridis TaxID=664880 RepID=A0ABT8AZX5_9NEIS|nr:LytTR family DNA-binding domain-containing protein [Chitinimonas viridis]MDN3575391.1 LytTR family DNA-binding domain-containing protein [Chitinimonas viridis]